MNRKMCFLKWAMVACTACLPAVVMRCDKAALNVQRGFYQGLGDELSDLVGDQLGAFVPDDAEDADDT